MSESDAAAHYLKKYFDGLNPITRVKVGSAVAICSCAVCAQIRELLKGVSDAANAIQTSETHKP